MEFMTIVVKFLAGIGLLAIPVIFLLPVVLIFWELVSGHQIKLRFLVRGLHRFSLRTFFIAITLLCVLQGIWYLVPGIVAMGFTICVIGGGPIVYLAFQEVRGKRTAARDFMTQKNKHKIQIPHSVSSSESDSGRKSAKTTGKRKAKHPAYPHRKVGFGRYGLWH
ncbi:MAG: hypothetical protein ACKVH8_20475 [Pirellulales bacterium]|jgi:hypothetical protein